MFEYSSYIMELIFMDNIVNLYDSQWAGYMAGLLFSNATLHPRCVSAHSCFLKLAKILFSWLKLDYSGLFYYGSYQSLAKLLL